MGDYIVEICGCDAKWFTQHQINEKVTKAFPTLDLKVITMMNQNPQVIISSYSRHCLLFFIFVFFLCTKRIPYQQHQILAFRRAATGVPVKIKIVKLAKINSVA